MVKCRDIDCETARKEVAGYFKRMGAACPDEAAGNLELDFDLVMKTTEELAKGRHTGGSLMDYCEEGDTIHGPEST